MSKDKESLEKLRASVFISHAVGQQVREQLIESLGDHMCGTGPGPSQQDVENLAMAHRQEAAARRKMERFVTELTRKFIAHVRCRR